MSDLYANAMGECVEVCSQGFRRIKHLSGSHLARLHSGNDGVGDGLPIGRRGRNEGERPFRICMQDAGVPDGTV